MNENLLDLSGKIDASTIAILDAIAQITGHLDIRFFLVGATARDLILHHGYGLNPGRATHDIDLAIKVSGWEEFDRVKTELIKTKSFHATREPHRLIYSNDFPLDIVPFGEIAGSEHEVSWPPNRAIKMRVLGFEEAHRSARLVRLRSDLPLEVRIATPAGLALLKLIAWDDRTTPERQKDALDLVFLLQVYTDAGNRERLLEQHTDLVGSDFDYEQSGARLLGRDVAALASEATKQAVVGIVERETRKDSPYNLVTEMTMGSQLSFEDNLALLEAFKRGLVETMPSSGKDRPSGAGSAP